MTKPTLKVDIGASLLGKATVSSQTSIIKLGRCVFRPMSAFGGVKRTFANPTCVRSSLAPHPRGQDMSALGQKQTYAAHKVMSALPPRATAKADSRIKPCLLCPRKRTCAVQLGMSALGQKRTHAVQQKESSSDQLVRAGEERRRSSLPMHVPKHARPGYSAARFAGGIAQLAAQANSRHLHGA